MIKVAIYYVAKHKDLSDSICEEYIHLIASFGVKMEFINLFGKNIKEKQKFNEKEARRSYTQEFTKVFRNNLYTIALTPQADMFDSLQFAEVLSKRADIGFFIGGAYGLEEEFIQKCDKKISLSSLTMSHKTAKIVLSEQIYRCFCLLNNHPYHK
ncbi:MAG: 23S rRNA (pseudouridine(1915)-N(3))-methyltransferase RlmH [Helicobacter sp.]|nr:23S rRNA (pseudouridine(1915)-N(3))-methyltransferase RlmH [Helicobacter sp.]